MTAIITTVVETRDDVKWLKRAVQVLLVNQGLTVESDDSEGDEE